jgi:hypothetical protein
MHLWKHSISSRNSRLTSNPNVVHHSEKSWLMGELVTSKITLLILPNWFWILAMKMKAKMIKKNSKKLEDEMTKKKMKNMGMNEASKENKMWKVKNKVLDWFIMNWWFAIQVLLLVLLFPVVLAFIALSVGEDIKMMIDRLCYWMIGKLCNSDGAPQVS